MLLKCLPFFIIDPIGLSAHLFIDVLACWLILYEVIILGDILFIVYISSLLTYA